MFIAIYLYCNNNYNYNYYKSSYDLNYKIPFEFVLKWDCSIIFI